MASIRTKTVEEARSWVVDAITSLIISIKWADSDEVRYDQESLKEAFEAYDRAIILRAQGFDKYLPPR